MRIPKTDSRWNTDCPPVDDDIFDASQIAVDPEHCRLGLGPGLVQRYGAALAAMGVIYRDVVAVRGAEAAPMEFLQLQLQVLRACEGTRRNIGGGRAIREAELLGRSEMQKAAKAAKALSAALAKSPQVMNWPLWLAMAQSKIRVRANASDALAEPTRHAFAQNVATWLRVLGEILETTDHQWLPPRPIENLIGVRRPDERLRTTGLMFELVVHFRNATAREKRLARAIGAPMHKDGKSHWSIVAHFVCAALDENVTGPECKNRVMSFLRRNPPLPGEKWDSSMVKSMVKTSVRLWSRSPDDRIRK
ncbi:MAG: hypothetical protein U1E60_18935 [Reyranellaceae bacterium]